MKAEYVNDDANGDDVQVDCPHGDVGLREGDMSTLVCAERFNKETNNRTMLPTQTLRADLNLRCASVHKPPHIHEPSPKFTGESMHSSSCMINHFFDNLRSIIQVLEEGQPFMDNMRRVHNEVGLLCDSLALKTPEKRKVTKSMIISSSSFTRRAISFAVIFRKL